VNTANPRLEPILFNNGSWSKPAGYFYPYCPGCNHVFYHAKPVLEHEAKAGLCGICASINVSSEGSTP